MAKNARTEKPPSAGSAGPLAALPPQLGCLLEGPSIIYLATRNADLVPASTMAFGLQVTPGGREVTLFVPAVMATETLANLRDNGQMAISFVRPSDHAATQVKGTWLGERRTDEADRAFIARYRDALVEEINLVGVPRSIWTRVVWWPSVALRMEVRDVFVQTPGPGAGRRVEPAGGAS
jgi:hypothetical protein